MATEEGTPPLKATLQYQYEPVHQFTSDVDGIPYQQQHQQQHHLNLSNSSPANFTPQTPRDGGSDKGNLMYQQQQAQRIARQLLNQPLPKHVTTGGGEIMYQQQQLPVQPSTTRIMQTYGFTYPPNSVNMPPLQGALQQELPASLSGDVMRSFDAGPHQHQRQQQQHQQQQQLHNGVQRQATGNGNVNLYPDSGTGTVQQSNGIVLNPGHPADEYLLHCGINPGVNQQASEEELAKRSRRSSRFRGVTRHRRSGRWEAHIWVKASGKQVYLGGYELEEHAAEAYDVAAIKCKGPKVKTNFPLEKYRELMRFMDTISLEELVMAVRRQSQGFARGSSGYRGVTHHPNGRWEARIGMPGSKHIYLGLFNEEQMAAQAYDRALVKLRGPAAATNFALSEYKPELQDYYRRIELQKDGGVTDVAAMLKADIKRQNAQEPIISTQGVVPDTSGIRNVIYPEDSIPPSNTVAGSLAKQEQ